MFKRYDDDNQCETLFRPYNDIKNKILLGVLMGSISYIYIM